jgi:predicted HTH transcriptional regulator
MRIVDLLKQPEGRRLEFKESVPTVSELARTIVAFANDAEGELYVGVFGTRQLPRFLKKWASLTNGEMA